MILDEEYKRYSESERKLKYKFNDLERIIFGLKTSDDDKVKIINIIKKCKTEKRVDFKFYQAVYNQDNGKIEHIEMNVLNESILK